LLYFNGRFENHAGKTFRALVPSSANDDGTFIIGSTAHIKEKALPFGHESLVGLAQHARVLCLEGEGKTQVAHSLGFAAISFKRFSREHAHLLNGRDIVICRDNDDAGLKQANAFKEVTLPTSCETFAMKAETMKMFAAQSTVVSRKPNPRRPVRMPRPALSLHKKYEKKTFSIPRHCGAHEHGSLDCENTVWHEALIQT
jgi:hypothetical protein